MYFDHLLGSWVAAIELDVPTHLEKVPSMMVTETTASMYKFLAVS